MDLLAGFDPGGNGAFGWAVGECQIDLPLVVRATGLSANADEVVREVIDRVGRDDRLLSAGVDAPLFWTPTGRRIADDRIRDGVRLRGCRTSAGTVQNPNSLQGACLVQGPMVAVLLRQQLPDILISECHPKALLWLLGIASRKRPHNLVAATDVPALCFPADHRYSEDERDAALGLLSAWAAYHRPMGWMDLHLLHLHDHSPICGTVSYWMPMARLA